MSDLVFQSKIPSDIRSKAIAKVIQIAKRFNFDPNALMIVIYKESRWNPKAKNSIGAVGLIQWLPSTARNVHGVSTDYILSLDILQQLEIVELYYAQPHLSKVKYKDYFDVYFAVFNPVLIGKPDNYVFAKKGTTIYSSNIGLDVDKDGVISVANVKNWFKKDVPDWEVLYEQFIAPQTKYLWLILFILAVAGVIYFTKAHKIIFNWLKS